MAGLDGRKLLKVKERNFSVPLTWLENNRLHGDAYPEVGFTIRLLSSDAEP